MADEFALKGLDAVIAKLKGLPGDIQKKALRPSMRKGAAIVRRAAIENAKQLDDPQTAEVIAKNIVIQYASKLSKKEGGVAFRVGVLGGARSTYANTKENRRKRRVGEDYGFTVSGKGKNNPGGDTFYWRFKEFGTSTVSATPFMLPALTQNVDAATEAISAELTKRITQLINV